MRLQRYTKDTVILLLGLWLLSPLMAAPTSPSPADLTKSWKKGNAHRAQISLNGYWKVSLQQSLSDIKPAGDYGIVAVPSAWTQPHEYPIHGLAGYSLGNWNGQATYQGKKMADYPVAWYTRSFIMPPNTMGKRVAIKLDRVTMNGTIYLNGKQLGSQNEWDSVEWDITDLVKHGVPNTLTVRVDAFLDKEITLHLGTEMTKKVKAKASLRGITQNSWLIITPKTSRIGRVAVTTSVRKQRISLQADVLNPKKCRETVRLVAKVFAPDRAEPVKEFSSRAVQLNGSLTQQISFHDIWKDPKLWDMGNPNLYKLQLELVRQDNTLDRTHPITFGFREIWSDGKDILLNGKPIHCINMALGGHSSLSKLAKNVIERDVDVLLAAGYNTIYLRCEGVWRQGHAAQYYDDILELADKKGIPVILPGMPVNNLDLDNPQEKTKWERITSDFISRYRNHPSVLFYALNFNYGGFPWDIIPHSWAEDYKAPDSILNLGLKRKKMTMSDEFVRQLDPSRIIYHHASSNFGSVMTSNFYCSWPPLQEREDFLSGWAATGIKPLMFVELGFPISLDYLRARHGNYSTVRYSEMLEAEYGAPYLGPKVYDLQSDEYLKILDSNATTEKVAMADKYNVNSAYFWRYRLKLHEPIQSIQSAIVPSYIRGWRTYGITGFCPWVGREQLYGQSFEAWHGAQARYDYRQPESPGPKPMVSYRSRSLDKPSPLLKQYATAFKPVLAYIGGSKEAGFSDKTHAWFSGDEVSKQIVIVNDLRQSLKLAAVWQLIDAKGNIQLSGKKPIAVGAGRRAFAPFSFIAPRVAEKCDFSLKLSVPGLPEGKYHVGDLQVQIFPKPSFTYIGRPVLLIDTQGETKTLLGKMGIEARLSKDGSEATAGDLIIIGRNTLNGKQELSSKVAEAVAAGARLLCFEQPSLTSFNLRTHERGVRRAFVLDGNSPLVRGFDDKDFADWSGSQSLLEAYPRPQKGSDGNYPDEAWRWGNKGTICSVMIEKPHFGSFKPLLECEFDLAYTPLLASSAGKGEVIFCQLEVTNRYGDVPVATLLLNQLLAYAGDPAPIAPVDVAVVGNDALSDYLKKIGVAPASQGELVPGKSICITDGIGVEQETGKRLIDFAKAGGTLIVFGQKALKGNWLPIATERKRYYRATTTRQAGELGISASDLFLKNLRNDQLPKPADNVALLARPGILAEARLGKGKVVILAIDPRPYAKEKKTPERMKRISHKLSRVLSSLIADAGGQLKGAATLAKSDNTTSEVKLPKKWRFAIDPRNKGRRKKWYKPKFDDKAWKMMPVPGMWEHHGVTDANPRFPEAKRPYDGYAWYRCQIVIPETMRNKPISLLLGVVDDMDVTYVNGERVGATGSDVKDYWAHVRDYPIPAALIRYGKANTIAVKVFDNYLDGGIKGPELKIYVPKTDTFPYMDAKPPFNPYKLKRW